MAKMIRQHKHIIMNWFKAKKNISPVFVEGLNNKVKLTFKKKFVFRTFDATEIQLYHTPEIYPYRNSPTIFFEEPKNFLSVISVLSVVKNCPFWFRLVRAVVRGGLI
jgi:hypothetical protein